MRGTLGTAGCLLAGALATGLAAMSAAAADAAAPTGRLNIVAWFDHDGDGTRNDGEPLLTDYTDFLIRNVDGGDAPAVPGPGVHTVRATPGTYELSIENYSATTGDTVRVTVPPGGEGTASFGLTGDAVSGMAWTDTNLDGVRQPDEPPYPGVLITARNSRAVTDAGGHYTVTDVARNEGLVAPGVTAGLLLPTPQDQVPGSFSADDPDSDTDSDFLPDGSTPVFGEPREHVDLGIAPGGYDQRVELRTDEDTEALLVGDEFNATITVRGWSGLAAQREVDVLPTGDPSGLEFAGIDAGTWSAQIAPDGRMARVRPDAPLPIGTAHRIAVRFRVTEPANSELVVRLNGRDSAGLDSVSQPVLISAR
jgi:hypothetical protein